MENNFSLFLIMFYIYINASQYDDTLFLFILFCLKYCLNFYIILSHEKKIGHRDYSPWAHGDQNGTASRDWAVTWAVIELWPSCDWAVT